MPDDLRERYDDALFALLMSDLLEEVGAYYCEENARLQEDPEAALSPAAERRSLRTLERAESAAQRKRLARTVSRTAVRVLAAAAAVVLVFTAAFAASEDFRVGTMNFVLDLGDTIGTWKLAEKTEPFVPDGVEIPPEQEAPDIQCRWLPEGFRRVADETPVVFLHEVRFENDTGEAFIIRATLMEENGTYNFDTENADVLEGIEVQGNPGVLVEKDGYVCVYWIAPDISAFMEMITSDLEADALLRIAEDTVLTPIS